MKGSEDSSETYHSKQTQIEVVPSAAALIIRALKEPPRHRRKQRSTRHNGNITSDGIVNSVRHTKKEQESITGKTVTKAQGKRAKNRMSYKPTRKQLTAAVGVRVSVTGRTRTEGCSRRTQTGGATAATRPHARHLQETRCRPGDTARGGERCSTQLKSKPGQQYSYQTK